MRQGNRMTYRWVKTPTWSWYLLCAAFCVLAPGAEVRAENVFGPYLTDEPPRIVETLSQETRDDVRITRLTYLNRTVPVTGEEVVIYGILARPVQDGTYPGILVCHGGSGNVSEESVHSWAKRGYVALGVDAPGYCNLTKTPTTGPWEKYKWYTFAVKGDDIRRNPLFDGVAAGLNALALLRARPDVDRTRIGIVGISWGGYMTTMLSGVAGDWVKASFSLYGCGYFDRGSEWMRPIHWWMKRRGETDTWLRHLDAGRRAAGIRSHFLMCAAANDWFFWLPAVMATYNEIQSPKSIVIAPNASHALPVPGGRRVGIHMAAMGLQWMDLHLKGEGKPFPTCQPVGRAVREGAAIKVCVQVESPAALKGVSVYHSAGEHPWRNRWWQQAETAQEGKGRFSASIPVHEPELPIHWLALASDERDISVSTTQQELAPLELGFKPEERSERLFHEDFESPDGRRKWALPFARHFGHARRAFSKAAAHTGKLGLSLSGRIVVCRGDIRGEALRRSGARGISLWARSEGGTGFHVALMAEGDNTGQRYYWYAPIENPGMDWTRIEIPWDRFAYVGSAGGTTFKPKGDLDATKSPSIAGVIMGEEEVPFSKEMIPACLAEFRIVTPEHAKIDIDDIEVLVGPARVSAPDSTPARAEATLEEINAARAARISPVPDVVGAVRVFGAEEARPSWNGMEGLTLERDAYGDGMHRVHIKKRTLGRSAYWKMHDIEPGDYYLGLWVESHHRGVALAGGSNAMMDMEYSPEHLLATLYLNGFPVRFHTTTDPVQVKEGVWLCELQTPAPVRIQEGDEIAFATVRWRLGGTRPVFRLALYREAPPAGHGITGQTLGVDHGTLQRLRLIPLASIEGSRIAGREHKARVVVANPLPSEVSAELEMALTDYFGKPVWTALERVAIPSHGTVEHTHAFETEARDHGYVLNVRTRPAPRYRYPRQRPPEWMALNSYTDVEFRPDMGDPLTSWHQARMRFHEVRSGARGKVSLAGRDWQRAWLTTRRAPDTVPEDLDYAPQTIASPEYATRLSVPEKKFGVWLKKTFVLPGFMKGQRILLQFTAVREGGVFVNGQYLGAQIGRFIPLLFDITAATREGENELVLCVREEVALVCDDFVDRYDRSDRKSIKENVARMTRWMSPGNVSCGSVTLMSEPRVGIRQAVTFSAPEKNLVRVVLRLRNSTDKPRSVKVAFAVDQQGNEKNVSIPPLSVTLPPDETVEAGTDGVANDLITYGPDRPVPARLTVLVSDTDGILLDEFQQRFGYRNYRVDGLVMRYNGLPARFQGSAFTRENSVLEREGCIRLERIANDEDRLDALSSLGMSVYPWVGTHGLNSRQTFLNERYWQDHRELAVEFMWRYGSQPCVVGLNISNETVYYNISPFSKDEIEQYADRIFSIANAVRETFDWDLWCQADGDGDLGGRLNFHSTHYLTQTSRYVPGTLGVHKRAESVGAYSPDRWYLSGAAHPPKHGTVMPRRVKPDFVYGSKALADTETFWFVLNGPTAARELGDRATVSSAWQFYTLEGRHWCWLTYEGYRDMDMCSHISLSWDDLYGTFQQPVWFALPEQQVRYYSGRRFDRRLNLHDDEFCPGDIQFVWDLRGTDWEPLEAGEILQRSSTAWLYRDRLAFDLPKVKERTELALTMKIEKGGRVFKHERRLVEVWPDRTASFTPGADGNVRSVQAVFDPRGNTAPLLDRVGWQAQRIDRLDAEALAGIDRLVIGAEVETQDAARTRGVLLRFMEKGGRVLMLHQTSADLVSETSDMYDGRGWVSTAFVRLPHHPVLKGLTDRDFTMWQPEHLLARGIYARGIKGDPFTGNALTLLDGYHAMSLNWSLLLELYAGTGSMLACQIRIPETFEDEPMSAELLRRMLKSLRDPAYKQMGRHLLVAEPASEAVIDALNNVRAQYEFAKRPPADAGDAVLLVDLSLKNGRPEIETLTAFARAGGILILHRARPEHASWLSALAGTSVTVDVQPYRSWADRQMLERRDGLLEGLSNVDLYWRPIFRDGTPFGFFQVSANPTHEHGQVQYVVRAKGADEYLFPGGLAELPVGAGRIVFDQLGWERPDEKSFLSSSYTYGILPSRTLAVLLTNLGIRRRQPAPPLELPPGVQYTTIDISAVANRALKDGQARDGIGWKDWGPDSDLSAFPTGRVTFNRVPFQVPEGRHNAIVLRPAKRWLPALAELPDTVVIPVNRSRVAGLWFLQTGGWTYGSKTFARREIRYADGTSETIRLSGLNFADWNIVRDSFPDERPDTRTLPAWTGTTKRWPVVRVYQQLWLNPTPGKHIKDVILTVADQPEDNRRFVAHLALTAALLLEPGTDGPAAEREPERSRELLAAARKLHQDGNKKGALDALYKALIADNTNAGAWDLYAALLAPDAEPAAFRSLCERWAAAIPEAARPWNVLGRFYESKKMMREALPAYRKSLDVEWNQPDIMKSIQRLERR